MLYGVDGKRRLTEITLDQLEGWRGSRPVRIGNAAERQYQADMYGLVAELSWRWSIRGHRPKAPYWAFLTRIIETAIAKWQLPDRGIWEVRSQAAAFRAFEGHVLGGGQSRHRSGAEVRLSCAARRGGAGCAMRCAARSRSGEWITSAVSSSAATAAGRSMPRLLLAAARGLRGVRR